MTKQEITAALLAGATATNSEFITIRRDQLVAALTPDAPAPAVAANEATHDDATATADGQPAADVGNIS